MTELEPRAGEELERQLERLRGCGSIRALPRRNAPRSAVMEAAWRQRSGAPARSNEEPSVAAAMMVLPSPSRAGAASRGLFAGWSSRRLGASFAAAMLTGLLLGTSAFASSRAGGPLYDTRLALEHLTLPSDTQARLEAELASPRAGSRRSSRQAPGTTPARSRPPSGPTSPHSMTSTSRSADRPTGRWSRSRPIARCSWRCAATCRPRHRQASRTPSPRAARSSTASAPPRRCRRPRAVPAHRVATAGPPAREPAGPVPTPVAASGTAAPGTAAQARAVAAAARSRIRRPRSPAPPSARADARAPQPDTVGAGQGPAG